MQLLHYNYPLINYKFSLDAQEKINNKMKHKISINHLTVAFASLFLCAIFYSCENVPKPKKAFILTKTDDNNWTTSANIECDSVDFVSTTHAVYWIDGSKFNLYAKSSIKLFSNPYYVAP